MQPTQIQDSTTLLTYSLTTTPMPVQVSPSATTASTANLTFVVSCPRSIGTATVAQIEIAVPVDGTDQPPSPTNLAATPPPRSSASISSSDSHKWSVAPGSSPGVFIFTPKGGPVQISLQSLTIEITGIQVNARVGTALVRIGEWAAPGTGAPPPVTGQPSGLSHFAVAKFPYGFYAGNFTADQPMIENGQQPTLSWQGSANATYKMLYEGNPPVDVSNIRTWSPTTPSPIGPSPVLTHTTTFILQVSAQVEGQTATVDFSITIEIDEPSLTAKDLTVRTTSNLQGAVSIGSTSRPADLAVNGSVQAGGILTAMQNLDVKGTTTLENTLNVTGAVTANGNLTVGGNAGIGNSLTAKSLIAGGGSFLFSGGSTDGSSNVVLRTDGNFAYLFPWGTGTNVNQVAIGGGVPTNFYVSGTTVLIGSVGIGTNTPGAPLHVATAQGSVPYSQICDQYLVLDEYQWNSGGGNFFRPSSLTDRGQTQFPNTSILAEGAIAAPVFYSFGFYTCSDARMKNVEGISDGAEDLRTLLDIEITDFRYKDMIANGTALHKKLVAQQVEQVFPQAVSKRTDVVPDIYRPAPCADGWVTLATDLKKGERVRLIADKAEGVFEVLEVTADNFRTDFKPESDKVFVFGREVEDFRTLDYDAIAMLNVSATQELHNRIEQQAEDIAVRDRQISSLEERLAQVEAIVQRNVERPHGAAEHRVAA